MISIFERIKAVFSDEPDCPDFGIPCRKHKCVAWAERKGKDFETGAFVCEEGCTKYNIIPKMYLEQTIEMQGLHAAMVDMRNEGVKQQTALQQAHTTAMLNLATTVQSGFALLAEEVPTQMLDGEIQHSNGEITHAQK